MGSMRLVLSGKQLVALKKFRSMPQFAVRLN